MLTPMRRLALALGIAAVTAGCPADPTLACVDDVDFSACQPLYAPTWANVYANTVARSCASGGGACHAVAGAQRGLILEGDHRAYASLTADQRYVIPGDTACSQVIERIYTPAASLLMPRGARLSAPEACAVARWVEAGAPGPVDLIDAGADALIDAGTDAATDASAGALP